MLKCVLPAVRARVLALPVAFLFIAAAMQSAQAQDVVLFVDGDDGLAIPVAGDEWGDAFLFLQDALAHADFLFSEELADSVQIWIKDREGGAAYLPDRCAICGPGGTPGGDGDRTRSFVLMNDVAMYGGFDGTEVLLEDRVPGATSSLSGDLDDNDNLGEFEAGDYDTYSQNSYNVVWGVEVDPSAVLDGIAVVGGNANGFGQAQNVGGGIANSYHASPLIRNCMVSHNRSSDWGGGAYNRDGSEAEYRDCVFAKNVTDGSGGGVMNWASDCMYARCQFIANSALLDGGGMMSRTHPAVVMFNVEFRQNTAGNYGGGFAMIGYEAGSHLVMNGLFHENVADVAGGAVHAEETSFGQLINCTLVANAAQDGSAVHCGVNDQLVIKNSILWDHEGDVVGTSDDGVVTITHSDVEGGYSGAGNINDDPDFASPGSGDFRLLSTSPCINAGNNDIPDDLADLNEDAITTGQETPLDLDEGSRRIGLAVEMGAFEFQVTCGEANLNGSDCDVNGIDMGILLSQWTADISYGGCPAAYRAADFNHDCKVNGIDLGILLIRWGPCHCAESVTGGAESLLSTMDALLSEPLMEWPAEASIDELWTWCYIMYGIYPDEVQ